MLFGRWFVAGLIRSHLLQWVLMQVSTDYSNDTHVKITVVADASELAPIKEATLQRLAKSQRNLPGFRKGKAPLAMVEKHLDQALLQSEFLQDAINELYGKALDAEKIRPTTQPEVQVTKFAPFDTLEFTAETDAIGKITLADYKKVKVAKQKVTVTAKDVDEVLQNLRERQAEKKDVKRAAKDGDQVTIDFSGVDNKTKEAIAGADGKEYPLVLGSGTFIPGFEPELVGLKAGDEKTFTVTFPKDYGTAALQNRKVDFTVKVQSVQEVTLPKLDDTFATTIGPFKKLDELKEDIKKQITFEREQQAEQAYENELITAIAEKSKVAIPEAMVDQQVERLEQEEKQNLLYRGQTWEDHLKLEGVTEEEHRKKNREPAALRVKAGLVLSEIAELEKISVSKEELELQLEMMKKQYTDEKMQAEIDKPENQRDIISRMLTQKTIAKVKEYAGK